MEEAGEGCPALPQELHLCIPALPQPSMGYSAQHLLLMAALFLTPPGGRGGLRKREAGGERAGG